MAASDVKIRHYREGDLDALLCRSDRLTIGIAPWRCEAGMRAASRTGVQTSVAKIGPDAAVFLAQRKGHMLGFASVAREVAFTGAAQAYIGELAVAAWAEGWARERGLRLLVLNTGAANERGRHFYVRSGFQEESVRLTKVLNEPGPTV